MMQVICDVYRSPVVEGMYLYVNKSNGLDAVPEVLLEKFGKPHQALRLLLTPEKKLARADTKKVIANLIKQGYYLQMPPAADDYSSEIQRHNTKLPGRF